MNKTFSRVVSILLLTGILTLAFSPQLANCANSPPDKPFKPGPDNGISGVSTSPALSVNVTDPDGESMNVSFYRVDQQQQPIDNFTIIALPDTQFYSESYPWIFDNQTQWIVNNADSRNIIFVTHEGDIVNVNTIAQWENANHSLSKLDGHVPWAVLPGTHDGNPSNLANYATYFNFNRFNGEGWYGGAYLDNNANSYELFSGGNDDYLIFHFQQSPSDSVLAWANTTIASHPNRRVIVTTHDYLWENGSRRPAGNDIWNGFVTHHANQIFLVLCGHMHAENRRADTVNGHIVHQLLADYQSRTNGGKGWLRILDFRPMEDKIYVKTYSPYLNSYETDADSEFTIDYGMTGLTPPTLIGTDTGVPSGGAASVPLSGLNYSTTYSWYAVADDSLAETQSDTWNFTTRTSDPFRGDRAFTASYDGSTRYYWLDMPDNFDNSTPTPLVFFLHGYGGSRYSYSQNYPVLRQIFQTHTWIVAAVECREIGSYDDWYTEPTRQDVADVLNILRHDYDIDSNHIHVMGNSMGGGGSLKMAMFYPETFASLCDIHGITNFTQFYIETTTFKTSLAAVYGGTPSQVPEVYANESALGNEDHFRITPVLIMHGTVDNVVNVSQSRYLNKSLSALGYTVNYVEVPGAGHNMQTVINGREMEIFNWFNDHPLLVSHSLHLDLGWNMVSFPVIPSNTSFASIFTGKGYYHVLTWSGTSYMPPTNAEAGRGYWVLVLTETTVNVTGSPVEEYALDLPAGWSMIGSVYGSTVGAATVFPEYFQLVTWSGTSYVAETVIEPGKGYWALVLTPTHIKVPPS